MVQRERVADMKFNLWYGQKRPTANQPGNFYYRPKSAKKALIMNAFDPDNKRAKKRYDVDTCGNIEITFAPHIQILVGLGYPIYKGNGLIASMDDCLFPDHPDFNNLILEAMSKAEKEVKVGG